MKHLVALSALATLSVIVACMQIPPPADTWGEPLEGVQLRLTLAKSVPTWLPLMSSAMPVFELQIRNRGSTSITVNPYLVHCATTEIDDVWYADPCVLTGGASTVDLGPPMVITPGSIGDVFYARPKPAVAMNARQPSSIEYFDVPHGTHRVRLRIPAGRDAIHTADGKALTLVSNCITIDIPESNAAPIKP